MRHVPCFEQAGSGTLVVRCVPDAAGWSGKVLAMTRKRLVYYITPHGFGHAVRSLEVIRLMLERMPDLEVTVVSDLPGFLIEECVGRPLSMRRRRLDIGLVQLDSLRFDLPATLDALRELMASGEALIEEEIRFLETQGAGGIVSDISFLPFFASFRCGLPSVGISNLSWDWIYESYARMDEGWRKVIEWIREGYRRCDLFLRLPMHGDCSAFPNIMDVPLISRVSARNREQLREILSDGSGRKSYLISFAALAMDREAVKRLEEMGGRIFLFGKPLSFRLANSVCLEDLPLSYHEVVGAVDGVITKPGYGIVSDCLAFGTPMLYTDRGRFPEYEILVEEMHRRLTAVYIPSHKLRSGDWEEVLKRLEESPRRYDPMRMDGASVCAHTILTKIFGER